MPNLNNVIIPEGVTSIGDSAFHYCSELANISIPNEVTSIGLACFTGCNNLNSITFNSPTTAIVDSPDTIDDTVKIIDSKNSTAEAYAKKYGRTFARHPYSFLIMPTDTNKFVNDQNHFFKDGEIQIRHLPYDSKELYDRKKLIQGQDKKTRKSILKESFSDGEDHAMASV